MAGGPDPSGSGDLVPTPAGEKGAGVSLQLARRQGRSSAGSWQGLLLLGWVSAQRPRGAAAREKRELSRSGAVVCSGTRPGGWGVGESNAPASHQKRTLADERPHEPGREDACWCRFPEPQPRAASARLR